MTGPFNNLPSEPEDRAAFEREWQLQERARREQREAHTAGGNPGVAEYRLVSAALRRPPASRPPSNFAHAVAELAALAHARPRWTCASSSACCVA